MRDKPAAPAVEYGVTPTHVMASMSGLNFVRAIFEGRLPAAQRERERRTTV